MINSFSKTDDFTKTHKRKKEKKKNESLKRPQPGCREGVLPQAPNYASQFGWFDVGAGGCTALCPHQEPGVCQASAWPSYYYYYSMYSSVQELSRKIRPY